MLPLACAATVHPDTMAAVVQVESGGNPYAVRVNGLPGPQPKPASASEAETVARRYIAAGYRVDLGLAQITDRNLAALGYGVEQMFDPCTNLAAAGAILTADYTRAAARLGAGQPALLSALSAYNTGTFWRGFANGYVARYRDGYTVPPLAEAPLAVLVTRAAATAPVPRPNPLTADTTVAWGFGDPEKDR